MAGKGNSGRNNAKIIRSGLQLEIIVPKDKSSTDTDDLSIFEFIVSQFGSYGVHLIVTIKCPDGYVSIGRKYPGQETLLNVHHYWKDTEESVKDVEDFGFHIEEYDRSYSILHKISEDIENGRMNEDENIQA